MPVVQPFLGATLLDRLPALIAAGRRRAAQAGGPVPVVAATPAAPFDPLALFARSQTPVRAYWERATPALALAALGATAEIRSDGERAIAQASAEWRALAARSAGEADDGAAAATPLCIGGFAFDPARSPDSVWSPWPRGWLIMPTVAAVRRNGVCTVQVQLLVDDDGPRPDLAAVAGMLQAVTQDSRAVLPDPPAAGDRAAHLLADPSRDQWPDRVDAIGGQIARGDLEKLVLARRVQIEAARPFDPGAVLPRLRARYGAGTLFALANGARCFLGATPEQLISVHGRAVIAAALAGSTPRGCTPDDDRARGLALRADPKERREHAIVTQALVDVLRPLCASLDLPDEPELLQLPDVQHLHTPVQGVLAQPAGVLELVERLHPTPAVGGSPRAAVWPLVRRYEPFDRGWFAGPLGWVDGRGDGDFVVAIRSALLDGRRASLFAGCGIVAGSDPAREYDESELKLHAMRWALGCP